LDFGRSLELELLVSQHFGLPFRALCARPTDRFN
jgi:hypothetical protein